MLPGERGGESRTYAANVDIRAGALVGRCEVVRGAPRAKEFNSEDLRCHHVLHKAARGSCASNPMKRVAPQASNPIKRSRIGPRLSAEARMLKPANRPGTIHGAHPR